MPCPLTNHGAGPRRAVDEMAGQALFEGSLRVESSPPDREEARGGDIESQPFAFVDVEDRLEIRVLCVLQDLGNAFDSLQWIRKSKCRV